jgi:hypothetical protein
MTPPKLTVDDEGRVHGANITWNSPFPCRNGDSGGMSVPASVLGLIMHTQVGNNPGSVATFNDPHSKASAHFCIAQDGSVVQMGPVNGWKAWAQGSGNSEYFSTEFADNQHPSNPLTQEQLNSGAQLLELLSRPATGRFPMQLTDHPGGEGFGWHGMGGEPYGGHFDCPGDVRKAQRSAIIELAQAIRGGDAGEVPGAEPVLVFTSAGQKSLAALAAQLSTQVSTILRFTAQTSPGAVYTERMADYLNGVFAADKEKVPQGITVFHPAGNDAQPFRSHGDQTLQGLALAFRCQPSAIVRLTAENSPGAAFGGDMAKYLDDVFGRSTTPVPEGIHLYYQK